MPRRCTICSHPDRSIIEEALRDGDSLRVLASRFDVTKDSLARHRQSHLIPSNGSPEMRRPEPQPIVEPIQSESESQNEPIGTGKKFNSLYEELKALLNGD